MDSENVFIIAAATVFISLMVTISGYSSYKEYLYNDYRKIAILKGETELDRKCSMTYDSVSQTAICLKYLDTRGK